MHMHHHTQKVLKVKQRVYSRLANHRMACKVYMAFGYVKYASTTTSLGCSNQNHTQNMHTTSSTSERQHSDRHKQQNHKTTLRT